MTLSCIYKDVIGAAGSVPCSCTCGTCQPAEQTSTVCAYLEPSVSPTGGRSVRHTRLPSILPHPCSTEDLSCRACDGPGHLPWNAVRQLAQQMVPRSPSPGSRPLTLGPVPRIPPAPAPACPTCCLQTADADITLPPPGACQPESSHALLPLPV